jgi:hypothetical protein
VLILVQNLANITFETVQKEGLFQEVHSFFKNVEMGDGICSITS